MIVHFRCIPQFEICTETKKYVQYVQGMNCNKKMKKINDKWLQFFEK